MLIIKRKWRLGAKHDKESLEKMVDPKVTNFVILVQGYYTLNTSTKKLKFYAKMRGSLKIIFLYENIVN